MVNIYDQVVLVINELNSFEEHKQISVFNNAMTQTKTILKDTKICRKETKFILNALKGIIDGYSEFSSNELIDEIQKIIDKFNIIKDNLIDYKRNSIFKTPFGKSYLDLTLEHFRSLARFQGYGKVLQNLINLKIENPDKIAWADERIDYLVANRDRTTNHSKGSFKDQLSALQSLVPKFSEDNGDKARVDINTNFSEDPILDEYTENFVKKLATLPKNILDDSIESGMTITAAVLSGAFPKAMLNKLKREGYKIDALSTSYVVIYNAKVFGAHHLLFKPKYVVGNKVKVGNKIGKIVRMLDIKANILFDDNTKAIHHINDVEVIGYNTVIPQGDLEKKMISMVDEKYFLIGKPLFYSSHCYWLCLEKTFRSINAPIWGFP